jgi:hypothetical protein
MEPSVFIRENQWLLFKSKIRREGPRNTRKKDVVFRALPCVPWLLILPGSDRSCWSRFDNFGNFQSLPAISANQSSIVLVRAARRGYRLYHQQPLQNALLMPHGAAINFRPRSIKDTPELTAVRPEENQTVILIEGSRLWQNPERFSEPTSFVRGKTRKGAPMFNAQINTIQPTQINTTTNGILVNGVRGEGVERRLKRRDCASKRSSDASLMASMSDSCGCPMPSHLMGHSEAWQGAYPAPAARPAAASLPAPIWGRLVVLRALSS